MKYLIGLFIIVLGINAYLYIPTLGAPSYTPLRTILPETADTFDIGSSTRQWATGYFNDLNVSSSLTLSNLTSGSVLFVATSGLIEQDNANLFWDNSNNRLGIGTATPQELLHVGEGTDASDITATGLLVTRAGSSNLSVRDSTNNVETFLFASTVGGIMGTVTNDPLNIKTNNTSAIFIDASQNVGIGTVVPGTLLHLNSLASTNVSLLTLESNINNADEYNEILFKVTGGANYGAIRSHVGALTGNSYMTFLTTTDGGTNLVQHMTIQHDGNVGIGTGSPGVKLEVKDGEIAINRAVADTGFRQILFQDAGFTQWAIGQRDGDHDLHFFDASTAGADDVIIFKAGTGDAVFGADLFFTGDGSGLPYGSMFQDNGGTVVTIGTIGLGVVIDGMSVGQTNLATFQNAKELAVTKAGRYRITWGVSFSTAGGSNQEIEGRIGVNDVANAQGSAHRFIGTATDKGNMGGTAILDLAASNRISIMLENDSDTQNILVDHASLTLIMVGGS